MSTRRKIKRIKRPSRRVIGIAYKTDGSDRGILLRRDCPTEADFNNKFAYAYEMASEVCLIYEGDEISPERFKYERKDI